MMVMSKKADDNQKRLKRCATCPWSRPQEYGPYPRLWDYMTCSRAAEKITEVGFCPLVR